MEVNIVKIGNSHGIRIPKAMLEQCRFNGKANIKVEKNSLVIAPIHKVRDGWEEDAKRCHAAGDDKLVWPDDMHDDFDSEWTWPSKP